MVTVTSKGRVHNALVVAALAGRFRLVSYPTPATLVVADTDTPPATYEVNEVSAEFITAKEWRRSHKQQRGEWAFEMHLAFDKEVTTELFERDLMGSPILLPRDTVNSLEAIIIRLHDVEWKHPPRKQASNGTRVTYRFVAESRPT